MPRPDWGVFTGELRSVRSSPSVISTFVSLVCMVLTYPLTFSPTESERDTCSGRLSIEDSDWEIIHCWSTDFTIVASGIFSPETIM